MGRKDESLQAKTSLIVEECIAVKLRLLTRAVTKIYNRALRPHGLTISQMNILVAASYIGQAKQQDICQALHLEKSTLSRDLAQRRRCPGRAGTTAHRERAFAMNQTRAQPADRHPLRPAATSPVASHHNQNR